MTISPIHAQDEKNDLLLYANDEVSNQNAHLGPVSDSVLRVKAYLNF